MQQTTVKPSSIRAYLDHVRSGKATGQREVVMSCIMNHAPVTRQMIHKITGIPINAVCGRVNSLLYPDPQDKTVEGPIKIAFHGKCPVTDKRVEFLEVRIARIETTQLELI